MELENKKTWEIMCEWRFYSFFDGEGSCREGFTAISRLKCKSAHPSLRKAEM